MDKYEYKVRLAEIMALIEKRDFVSALELADMIDWRRVKSPMTLCKISDLYKINRKFEESKALLQMAYDRHPNGKSIVRSLCKLSIKMGDIVSAMNYFNEFVRLAPNDNSRYILQYRIYEAQEVGLEERIAVLEELKKREYDEKWAYELAYLYHRVGLATKCVEECDELILWFGDGEYVKKAMELKMLHQPLSESQEEKYNRMLQTSGATVENHALIDQDDPFNEEDDIKVHPVNVGQYDTMNLQKALAESMQELMNDASEDSEQKLTNNTEEIYTEEINDAIPDFPEKEKENLVMDYTEAIPPMQMNVLQPEKLPETQEVFFNDSDTGEINMSEENSQISFLKNLNAAYDSILAQEYDGQISLVVPEADQVERQITGQLSIIDIMSEWEKMKKDNEQKRAEENRKRVMEQTGSLFSEFDEQTRSGILAQLNDMPLFGEEEKTHRPSVAMREYEKKAIDESNIVPFKAEKKDEPSSLENEEKVEDLEEVQEELSKEEQMNEMFSEDVSSVDTEDDMIQIKEEEDNEDSDEENIEEENIQEESVTKQKADNKLRSMTEREKNLFASFVQTRRTRDQIIRAMDAVTLKPFVGNLIITGEPGSGALDFARNMVKAQAIHKAFSGKVAKISGNAFNTKDIGMILEKLANGALIIDHVGGLKKETVQNLKEHICRLKTGIIVMLEDTKLSMNRFLEENPEIKENFNIRVDIEALDNDALVAFGKRYAEEMEYTIDDLGVLALYTRIADLQTSDHVVTAAEVRDIVKDAIHHANKKNITHLMDVVLSKRYDKDDMIILRERDFT